MLIHTHLPNGEVNMAEYTTEENLELLDTIKKPIRYYRIMLWGYGGESSYMSLEKEGYDYWKEQYDEEGEYPLTEYMLKAEDMEEFDGPPDADFLLAERDTPDPYRSPWYEAPTQVVHQYGVDYSNCKIQIDEIENLEPTSNHVKEIVDMDLNEYCEENNVDVQMDVDETDEPDYVLQMLSAEKGTFFEAVIESKGPYDPKKLKIFTTEYWNGDDTIESIEYDGEDLDNFGGDTNGKGYSAHLWSNV